MESLVNFLLNNLMVFALLAALIIVMLFPDKFSGANPARWLRLRGEARRRRKIGRSGETKIIMVRFQNDRLEKILCVEWESTDCVLEIELPKGNRLIRDWADVQDVS